MFIPFEKMRAMCRARIAMLEKQGYDFPAEEWLAELAALPDSYDALIAFGKKLSPTKTRADFPYEEPDELDSIRAARPEGHRDLLPLPLAEEEIRDKVYGGVFGRIAGCMLGKPLEISWTLADIRDYLTAVNAWPLSDFVPQYSNAQKRFLRRDCVPSMKGFVRYAQADDDINYLVLGLKVLEKYGRHFRSQDVARIWAENIPYNWTWGPEHSRYMLLTGALIDHNGALPEGRDWYDFTTFLNGDEEVIGAMIRGDAFGLVNPGRPEAAADMAWRDGYFTHKKTGLYAEMWVAATVAAAFATFDPADAIRIGIEQLPKNARYTEVLHRALEISLREPDWLRAYEEINALWGHLGHAGTMNETAAIINALVHSVDETGLVDYEKAICLTVMHGWDTDCSGATAGCIAGVLAGHHRIPEKWTAPFCNTMHTAAATEENTKIDAFAERMYQMSRILRG